MPLLRGCSPPVAAAMAGTATAVSDRVPRRQQNRWAEQDDQQYAQQQPQAAPPPQPAPPARDVVAQLEDLAELKSQGILTDASSTHRKRSCWLSCAPPAPSFRLVTPEKKEHPKCRVGGPKPKPGPPTLRLCRRRFP